MTGLCDHHEHSDSLDDEITAWVLRHKLPIGLRDGFFETQELDGATVKLSRGGDMGMRGGVLCIYHGDYRLTVRIGDKAGVKSRAMSRIKKPKLTLTPIYEVAEESELVWLTWFAAARAGTSS